MVDRYRQLVSSPAGGRVAATLGLPRPEELRRYEADGRAPRDEPAHQPLVVGPLLAGGAPGGRLLDATVAVCRGARVDVRTDAAEADEEFGALVYDASAITEPAGLRGLYDFFHPAVRRLRPSGRVLVLGAPPEEARAPAQAAAQRALSGFVRSLGKEVRRGATVQLVRAGERGETGMESTLRFLLSAKSAYVSGQEITVASREGQPPREPEDWDRPLAGTVALVTGAARGIGEQIAAVLARDGAHVVGVDVPAQGDALSAVANRVGGSALQADITDPSAPTRIARHLQERHGGVDVVVHNAGVTRDKTLAGMDEARWDLVIEVNLAAPQRITDELLSAGVLRPAGRIVAVSSLSGIAGNRGQTNYAASKAGLIGLVTALAAGLDAGRTANAVAPGFIETEMTAAMPLGVREAGRRMNSLRQGGLPVDVAETVAWLASPGSTWVNGQVVRVCGQSLLGA